MHGLGSVVVINPDNVTELSGGCEVLSLIRGGEGAATLANGLLLTFSENGMPSTLDLTALDDIAKAMSLKSIAVGGTHGLASTVLGAVYEWGRPNDPSAMYLHASLNDRITEVAAGMGHSLALSGKSVRCYSEAACSLCLRARFRLHLSENHCKPPPSLFSFFPSLLRRVWVRVRLGRRQHGAMWSRLNVCGGARRLQGHI
jgi:hypothetical protein